MWRGGFRLGLSVTGPFGCRCLTSFAMLRFHIPLIKPGVQFSRTRLSDKAVCSCDTHTFAHEPLRLASGKLVQAQLPIQVGVRVLTFPLARYLEFRTQPLTYPVTDVAVNVSVGLADGADAEIVGPAA